MKKIVLAAVGVMLAATPALAEHKLLITDVLDQKQIEAQATFEYTHLTSDLKSPEEHGKQTLNGTESNYSLGVGLGHGLEVTASIPYVFSERDNTQFTGSEAEIEKRDGFGDFALQAKYLLLGGEEEKYAVVTGLGVKFDTAAKDDAGTGTTDISPFIAASTKLGHHYTPYAIYRATLRNHDVQDTHTLSVGLEKQINETFTLDGKIDANFNTASDKVAANEDFVFELSSYIQVAHNLYLLPSVAYLKGTDTTAEGVRISNTDGVRVGAALYYLY
ncbi:MAG TPA: transporter [Geomonas sp.]|nr:transporter [Geomonas sp.]